MKNDRFLIVGHWENERLATLGELEKNKKFERNEMLVLNLFNYSALFVFILIGWSINHVL